MLLFPSVDLFGSLGQGFPIEYMHNNLHSCPHGDSLANAFGLYLCGADRRPSGSEWVTIRLSGKGDSIGRDRSADAFLNAEGNMEGALSRAPES